jgi:hypothetical protein
MTIYIGYWADEKHWKGAGLDGLKRDFEIGASELKGVEILLAAYYDPWGYSGLAFVLFQRDGGLYEVNASHCSCYGLEGQWSPEETTIKALRARVCENDSCDGREIYGNELGEILDSLEEMQ